MAGVPESTVTVTDCLHNQLIFLFSARAAEGSLDNRMGQKDAISPSIFNQPPFLASPISLLTELE